jgi:hypothetical protein
MGGYAFVSSLDRRLTRRAAAPHVLSQSSRRSVVLSSSPCVLIACFPIILSSQQPSSAGRTGLIGIIVSRPPVSERWAHRCLDCDSTVLVLAGDVSQAKNACRRSKQSPSKNPSSTTGTDTDDVARVLCHSSQLAFPSERHSESVSTVPLRRQASQAAVPVSFLLFIAAITIPISAQVNNHHGSGSRRQEASSINSKPTPLHQKTSDSPLHWGREGQTRSPLSPGQCGSEKKRRREEDVLTFANGCACTTERPNGLAAARSHPPPDEL